MGDFLPHREAVCFYLPVLLRTSTYYRGLLLLSAADTPHTRTCQEQRQRDYGELWQPLTSSCKGCAGGARGTALSTLCMKTQDRPITYTMYGTWRCFTPNCTLISNLNLHTLSSSHAILDHFQPLDGCICSFSYPTNKPIVLLATVGLVPGCLRLIFAIDTPPGNAGYSATALFLSLMSN